MASLLGLYAIFTGARVGLSDTAVAPLSRVKLLLQLQRGFAQKESLPKYSGIIQTFKSVVREQGFLSLWRGNLSMLFIYFPAFFANFASLYMIELYEFSHLFDYSQDQNSLNKVFKYIPIAAASLASHPFNIAWVKIATDTSPIKQTGSVRSVIKNIYQTTGFRSLYNGYFTRLFGILINGPVRVGAHDSLHDVILDRNSGFFTKFAYSQIITAISWIVFYPLDTVSKRLMLQAGSKNSLSTAALIKQIYQNEGKILGFYRGWLCNIIGLTANAFLLATF